MKTLYNLYFSPTHTTRRITEAIAIGYGFEENRAMDITFHDSDENIQFSSQEILVVGMPVYGGRLPELAASRVNSIQGNGAKAIIAVVYGNRAYEDALLELKNLMVDKGFHVVAAGAFIGEHSYSSQSRPIAENRPHQQDIQRAVEWGHDVRKRVDRGHFKEEDISVPGSFPYKKGMPPMNIAPETSEAACTKCMKCISVCPAHAIGVKNPLFTDKEACIRCCACIKVCGFNARTFTDPGMEGLTQKLYENCQEPKAPEVFLLP